MLSCIDRFPFIENGLNIMLHRLTPTYNEVGYANDAYGDSSSINVVFLVFLFDSWYTCRKRYHYLCFIFEETDLERLLANFSSLSAL